MKKSFWLFSLSLVLTSLGNVLGQDGASRPMIPPGDSANGESIFLEQRCYRCHTLEGRELPDFDLPAKLKIHLGGDTHTLWDRDEFGRAILNPEHVVSPQYQAIMIQAGDEKGSQETPMPNFNAVLTISDLIDLATFLDSMRKGG
tara:strand:- start:12230 stop:12664 length:435 start_codon:yes stop_codon:yes gene_type:complete